MVIVKPNIMVSIEKPLTHLWVPMHARLKCMKQTSVVTSSLPAINYLLGGGGGMRPGMLSINLRHCKVSFFQRNILLDTNSTNLALQGGKSALWWASDAGETECMKVLVKYGAQVDLPARHDVQK